MPERSRDGSWNEGKDSRHRTACNSSSVREELFETYITGKNLCIDDTNTRIGKIVDADLLNGARDWSQYSYGGCADIYDSDICERLCCPSEVKKKKHSELPLNANETWLDVQAKALKQAARLVK